MGFDSVGKQSADSPEFAGLYLCGTQTGLHVSGPHPRTRRLDPAFSTTSTTSRRAATTIEKMSTSDAVIDPALRDLPAPQHAGGMKRKARSSASGTTPSQKQPTTPARLTRRQAAAAAAGSAPSTSAAASKSRRGRGAATSGAEPSRGEEENLITYDWARNSNTVSVLWRVRPCHLRPRRV